MNVLRAMNGKTDGNVIRYFNLTMGQEAFTPPSVFNYYPPDYVLASEKISAPEFGIQNSSTAMLRINFAASMLFNRPAYYDAAQNKYITPLADTITGTYRDSNFNGSIGTTIDWASWKPIAADTTKLIEKLNALMFHGSMSTGMKTSLTKAVNAVAADDLLLRARTAVYLSVTSPQFQVER